jgi:hypothetical protein
MFCFSAGTCFHSYRSKAAAYPEKYTVHTFNKKVLHALREAA